MVKDSKINVGFKCLLVTRRVIIKETGAVNWHWHTEVCANTSALHKI